MTDSHHMRAQLIARDKGAALTRPFYCDESHYRLDLEQIWYREWIFAAPASAAPKAGNYITLQLGDYPVVVIRGKDGRIRAFHNVCRHRGQRLCATPSGSTTNLVCPYHQWTYDLEGKLVFARDMGADFNPAAFGLKKVHCIDMAGLVYICLADVPPPIADLAQQVAAFVGPSGLQNAKVAHSMSIVESGNWKLVMENNRECYHCGGSHPSLCRTYSDDPRRTAITGADAANPEILAHWARCEAAGLPSRFVAGPRLQWRLTRMPLLDGAESFTMDTKAAVAKRMGSMPFNDAGSALFYHYPSSWNHFLPDHAITFRILPISATQTEVTTFWLTHEEAVAGVDYDPERLTEVWIATNDEDRRVVEENQKGILSPAYTPGPYSTLQEMGVIQFIDWYAETMIERLPEDHAMAAE